MKASFAEDERVRLAFITYLSKIQGIWFRLNPLKYITQLFCWGDVYNCNSKILLLLKNKPFSCAGQNLIGRKRELTTTGVKPCMCRKPKFTTLLKLMRLAKDMF